jgi:hypothetical protein
MSDDTTETLYNLLPAVYRLRDAEEGEPLAALLSVADAEFSLLKQDIAGLYANWFVETCDEWVVPYIGDLLGVRGMQPVTPGGQFSQRGYVANTLAYRRRKGTVAVIEQLGRDITGWPAKAVEFFQLLVATQNVNHVRRHSLATTSVRDANRLELLGGPFETAAHTAEVRHIDNGRGRYNIPHVGVFLWRLQAYKIDRGTAYPAAAAADGRYTFHPFGYTLPLFNQPQTEVEIGDAAEEINVPGPLRRRPLYDELVERRDLIAAGSPPGGAYFGSAPRVSVFADGLELQPEEITICNLATWNRPQPLGFTRFGGPGYAIRAAVDPVLGRLAFAVGDAPAKVEVSYSYGFPADMGGGSYPRGQGIAEPKPEAWLEQDTVDDPLVLDRLFRVPADYPDPAAAVQAWADAARPPAIIQIEDSHTYPGDLNIVLAGRDLVIQAKDQQRPALDGHINVTGGAGRLALNGLLIRGGLHVTGDPAALSLAHCTLVPGHPLQGDSISVDPRGDKLTVLIDRCICGSLNLPSTLAGLAVYDSIIAAPPRVLPVLVSGSLAAFPVFDHDPPQVSLTLGRDGPYVVQLASAPADIAAARAALEAAIRGAGPGPAFRQARVLIVRDPDRLVVVPGAPGEIAIGPTDADATSAAKLGLDEGSGRHALAFVGGRTVAGAALSAANPVIAVSMGGETLTETPLPAAGGSGTALEQAAARLQAAIRAVGADAAYTDALALALDDRLFVVPGTPDARAHFGAAAADRFTVDELGLGEGGSPAISSDGDAARLGPRSRLIRTTIFGPVRLTELELGSECIFVDNLAVERRQEGCLRFSYAPPGSLTPRRFRCQPDLAIADALADRPGLTPGQQAEISAAVVARVAPTFNAARYGAAAYAQLAAACAVEIRTGAEDGSEMGAYSLLKQPQREANLTAALAEYLRFGLEAGIFYVDYLDTEGEGA